MADPSLPTTTACQPGCEGLLRLGTQMAEASACGGFGRSERMECEATRFHVWAQTPRSVWDAYAEDGYTLQEAIGMEMSYA